MNEAAHLSGVSQACDRVGTERALKRGVTTPTPIALTFVSPVEYHATMGGLEFRLKSHDGKAWELGPLVTGSAAADLISRDKDGTGSAWVDFSRLEYALRFLSQAEIY